MPVKTFIAGFSHEDWCYGEGRNTYSFDEVIKARNKKEAEEKAGQLSLEMGPDTMLMSVTQRRKLSMSRLKDKYRKWMRRQERPTQYRHRLSHRRRA